MAAQDKKSGNFAQIRRRRPQRAAPPTQRTSSGTHRSTSLSRLLARQECRNAAAGFKRWPWVWANCWRRAQGPLWPRIVLISCFIASPRGAGAGLGLGCCGCRSGSSTSSPCTTGLRAAFMNFMHIHASGTAAMQRPTLVCPHNRWPGNGNINTAFAHNLPFNHRHFVPVQSSPCRCAVADAQSLVGKSLQAPSTTHADRRPRRGSYC